MNPQTGLLLMLALIAVGSYGWGSVLVAVLSRRARAAPPIDLDAPMKIAIGIALFLAFGGVAVALDLAYFVTLFVWQLIGVAFTIGQVVQRIRRGGLPPRPRWSAPVAGLCAIGGLVVALAPFGLARWSEADDAPGYTYLAQRLLATGGLIDPFNSRRVQNYGGAELIQSLVLRVAGTTALDAIEAFFYCSLAVALLVRSLRRPYAALMILTVGLAIVVAQPVGDWSNTGPTFSETVLLLGLVRLFADYQRRGEPQDWLFVIGGVFFAGLFSLRPQGVSAALAVIIAAALFRDGVRAKLRSALLAGGSTVVCLLGWAIALKRSSDDWVFGIDMPSWTQASWSVNPQIKTLHQHLAFFVRLTGVDSWRTGVFCSLALVVLAGALVFLVRRSRGERPSPVEIIRALRADLLVALVVGSAALLLIFSYPGDGDAIDSIGHYFAPILLAPVLFSIDRVWLVATTDSGGGEREPLPKAPLAVLGGAVLGFVYLFCDLPLTTVFHDVNSSAREGVAILRGQPSPPLNQTYWDDHYLSFYNQLEASIPKGAYVLSGVEFPGMLDFQRFRFTTVDEAYGNSPPPHLPPSGNPRATVRYLESLGIDGIIAESPSAPFYYNYADNYQYSHQDVRNYQLQDGSLVKWDNTLTKIEKLYKTTTLSDLVYVSFHWLLPLAPSTGSFHWLLPLAPSTGSFHWLLPLAPSTGSFHWLLPLAPSTGVAPLDPRGKWPVDTTEWRDHATGARSATGGGVAGPAIASGAGV